MNKYYLRIVSFMALFAMAVALLPANASGVTVTSTTPSLGEIDSATAQGYAEIGVTWTPSGEYVTGTTITMNVEWSDGSAPSSTEQLIACSPEQTTAFTAGGSFVYGATGIATWTFASSTGAAPASDELCFAVPVTTDAAGTLAQENFSVAILTSGTTGDFGATMFYVNGGNDVTVTGLVTATLAFVITDPTDEDLPLTNNLCDLGTLTAASVNTCSYRLRIETNASNGFDTTIQAATDLGSGAATLTNIAENGTVTAGTEGYGMRVVGATAGGRNAGTGAYDQPVVEEDPFDDDDTPVPTVVDGIINYTDGFRVAALADTTLITHAAAISGGTPAGYYTQEVTYRVTGNF
ncbi:hypothetical protein KKG46_00175 [Patescibacteria group bacterium]|nr:hypothetical protein [Patescibacteria group bacterium]